jgi:hypothetical protein
MFRERAASIGDDVECAFLISLAEDAAVAAFVFVIAGCCVDDENVRSVFARIINDRFRTECSAKSDKGAESGWGECAAPPECVFACENVERRGPKQKISYVSSEEVSKAKKLSNLENVSRGVITDGGELIKARQDAIRGQAEVKISDVGGARITLFKIEFEVC